MAAMEVTCKQCQHKFYRIIVECNKEGIEIICPNCTSTEVDLHVMLRADGKNPFSPCSHI